MIEYRPFRNTDPPGLAALWNDVFTGRGAVQMRTASPLEFFVFSKPYFDPEGLIVAVMNNVPVGFVHAGFGSNADGSALSDSDWDSKDGHYRVRVPRLGYVLEGQRQELVWVDVPEEAVISEPNRVGRTMVWPIYGYTGVTIRCFMPGSMT